MSLLKRKLPPSDGRRRELTDHEQAVYDMIRSRGNMGILKAELKRELKGINDRAFNNCVQSLQAKQKIKEVKSVQNKKVHLMAMEFEASTELTGGAWYSEGVLDTEFVEGLRMCCLGLIRELKVATVDQLSELGNKRSVFNVQISTGQIMEILNNLVLGNEITKVKRNGSGEYESIPVGMVCYKNTRKADATQAMVSMPCGSCPRINQCTPNGAISPATCEYYNKWLSF